MAKQILLTSGSILAGNPITFSIKPSDAGTSPSFHRVIVEVTYDNNNGNYEVIKLSVPVTQEGKDVVLDVSSALRVPLEDFQYSPLVATYPMVKWYIKAYDEYMNSNGELKTNQGIQYYPQEPNTSDGGATNLRCIAGAFWDIERMVSGVTKSVKSLSRKPQSLPQLMVVGDTYAYTPAYSESQSLLGSSGLNGLTAPQSREVEITKEGLQTIGEQSIYAMPKDEGKDRMVFRFINSFGVLECVSIPRTYSKKLSIQSSSYTVTKLETFNSFSRSAVSKKNDRESWLFMTDPLDENWLQWYLHEFLMSNHIWINVKGNWIPVTVIPEDEITFLDKTNTNMYSVSFTAKLDIYGPASV
jgi:hypothetical protein